MEDGYPVFKICYDKIITDRLAYSSDKKPWLSFIVREWKVSTTGAWENTAKTIFLNLQQFNRLSGLLMSGAADLADDCLATGEYTPRFHLGFGVYFS